MGLLSIPNINIVKSESRKAFLVYASCLLYLSCSILTMTAVTYEAVTIATHYDSAGNEEVIIREPVLFYTFGRDIWFGWTVSFVAFINGIGLGITNCKRNDKQYDITTDS